MATVELRDLKTYNRDVIEEFRRGGGSVARIGLPVLLLTTTGRRSGRAHTNPVGYVEDGGRLVMAASAAGSATDPDWYRNLVACPSVTVEVGSDTLTARAAVATGAERDRLFGRLTATLPPLAGYAADAGREVPVVTLTPEGGALALSAARLRSLHRPGTPLVLVNAWDVASAHRVVAAGARAVGTSSAAIAACLGLPDDPSTPVPAMFEAIARIASSVDVPVTADLLDGYGLDPAELVERLLAAGAVGCNLEDSDHGHPGTLLDPAVVAERIAAVRAAATRAGVPVVVNARIDAYLHHGPEATPDVRTRARHYLDAGADCVYPVRLTDPHTVQHLAGRLDAPVNANLAGRTTVADLATAGASRVSTGPAAFHTTFATLDELAATLLA